MEKRPRSVIHIDSKAGRNTALALELILLSKLVACNNASDNLPLSANMETQRQAGIPLGFYNTTAFHRSENPEAVTQNEQQLGTFLNSYAIVGYDFSLGTEPPPLSFEIYAHERGSMVAFYDERGTAGSAYFIEPKYEQTGGKPSLVYYAISENDDGDPVNLQFMRLDLDYSDPRITQLVTKANEGDEQAISELNALFTDLDNPLSATLTNLHTGAEMTTDVHTVSTGEAPTPEPRTPTGLDQFIRLITGVRPVQAAAIEVTETPITPRVTDTPERPTQTPTITPTEADPLSSIDLRNPATYPDWMSYFTRGEFPTVEAQKSMSADMFQLYRNLLIDRGVDGVEAMNDSQVFFMAGQIANQEGWNLPANLDATRNWFAGPQAAFYRDISNGVVENGIFSTSRLTDADTFTIPLAHIPGEIITNTFGEDVLLQRQMPYGGIIASDGILVNLTNNKLAIILHYQNNGQDYYMPLSVLVSDTNTTERIGALDVGAPYQVLPSVATIPASIGLNGSFNNTPDNVWTESELRQRMSLAELVSAIPYSNARESNPLVNDLEFAYQILISP